MRPIYHSLFLLLSIFLISLFYGCSGHALQDLIDGDQADISSAKEQTQPLKTAPSQNEALNSISPSSTAGDEHEEYRYIQKNTNTWIEEEWTPLTEQNQSDTNRNILDNNNTQIESNTSSGNKDDNSSFTLQYYVDKAGLYLENKKKRDANKTKEPSHTEKINTLPAIGKSNKRR